MFLVLPSVLGQEEGDPFLEEPGLACTFQHLGPSENVLSLGAFVLRPLGEGPEVLKDRGRSQFGFEELELEL